MTVMTDSAHAQTPTESLLRFAFKLNELKVHEYTLEGNFLQYTFLLIPLKMAEIGLSLTEGDTRLMCHSVSRGYVESV